MACAGADRGDAATVPVKPRSGRTHGNRYGRFGGDARVRHSWHRARAHRVYARTDSCSLEEQDGPTGKLRAWNLHCRGALAAPGKIAGTRRVAQLPYVPVILQSTM